jgi:methionine synthase / methylenetetrahydrofolate reductase(NADPH)
VKLDFRTALKSTVMVGDGAMGTLLYQQGFPVGISYEELNLLHPEVIASVHKQYYDAGARVIETNTFSANREKLSKFGLENEVAAINKAGVELARQAVGDDAYVIGSIGSVQTAKRINIRSSRIEEALREQITALIDAGPDGLLLETFYHMNEMELALRLIRELSDIPVICQFATEGTMTTLDGVPLQEAFDRLAVLGADVIGFNCQIGPNGIMRTIEKLTAPADIPFSVFPNAGMPDYVDGRVTFGATPEYFAECAAQFAALGAHIIGGCCGTTPKHIAAIAQALSGVAAGTSAAVRLEQRRTEGAAAVVTPPAEEQLGVVDAGEAEPSAKPTLLDIVKQRHTVIVELDPPRDLDISKFMRGAKALQEAGVDAVTMADNSLAVTRMSNMALGQMVQADCGVRPLIHIAGRDRNLIGTQSHLMGLHALGIDHVLAVTGDPSRFGDLPGSSSVYDLSSFDMIRLIKQLNEGIAFSGKPLKRKANFLIGAALNPNVKFLDKAIQRMERKIMLGADYIMTQPIYDPKLIEQLYESTKHLDIPIFIGVMPLASGRNAEYLHNEVPGIQLSDEIRKRMAGLEGEEGRRVGVEIAKELLDVSMKYFKGVYLMTPFLFYEMSTELTKYVWEKAGACTSNQNGLQ